MTMSVKTTHFSESVSQTGAREELANALVALGQALRRPDLEIGVDFTSALSVFKQIPAPNVTPASQQIPLQIEDRVARKLRRLINGNLRRQHALYRIGFGIHLARNRAYRSWMEKIIPLALNAHSGKMNYLGVVIGSDILGPGKGLSTARALEAVEKLVPIEQKSLRFVLEKDVFNDPVETSYVFWGHNSGEPDTGLAAVSTDALWRSKKRIETEDVLEHLLHYCAFFLHKTTMMNQKFSTLCSGVVANLDVKHGLERTPKVSTRHDTIVIESSLNSAQLKHYCHRPIKRVHLV